MLCICPCLLFLQILASLSFGGIYQQWLHLAAGGFTHSCIGTCSCCSSSLLMRCVKSLRSSEVKHFPVASSNCQPCIVQVRTPSSILPKRVRSAFKWGHRRCMR